MDAGSPDELARSFAPWADVPSSRRGRHLYYDDDQPRGNAAWKLGELRGDLRSARGFLVLHNDAPIRLTDALDKRVPGRHPFPRDLFELAGFDLVLADPVPVSIDTETVRAPADAPIQIHLERIGKGRRGLALFDQCRWWSYLQDKGVSLGSWQRRVLAYVTDQNTRFRVPHGGAGALDRLEHCELDLERRRLARPRVQGAVSPGARLGSGEAVSDVRPGPLHRGAARRGRPPSRGSSCVRRVTSNGLQDTRQTQKATARTSKLFAYLIVQGGLRGSEPVRTENRKSMVRPTGRRARASQPARARRVRGVRGERG